MDLESFNVGRLLPSLWHAADEIGCVVDAAGSFVFRDLRIGTQWTCAVHLAIGAMRRVQLFRCFAVFHPLLERTDFVEHIRLFLAPGMGHCGARNSRMLLDASVVPPKLSTTLL